MNYNYIVNPETGKKCKLHGKLGKNILKNYILLLNGGGSNCSKFHNDPDTCLKTKTAVNAQCLYRNRNGGQCYLNNTVKGGKRNKRRNRKKRIKTTKTNVVTSSLTKKNIVKRCRPCLKANKTRKWDKLNCDWCIGKDEVLKNRLDSTNFTGFQEIKNKNLEFDLKEREFIFKAMQKENEQIQGAKKVCNSNLEKVGLSWNDKSNSCTIDYQTAICRKNNISTSGCSEYMNELNKKKKKNNSNDVCNVDKKNKK